MKHFDVTQLRTKGFMPAAGVRTGSLNPAMVTKTHLGQQRIANYQNIFSASKCYVMRT